MPQKTKFHVEAIWDAEFNVWRSQTDIEGLVIETDTLEAFEEVLEDVAVDLIIANHWGGSIDPDKALSELIPTIVWKKPATEAA